MNRLEIHWSFWTAGQQNISYYHLKCSDASVIHRFVYCSVRKGVSAKSHVIKEGYQGPLIGLCCHELFIQMIGCPSGNVYSD